MTRTTVTTAGTSYQVSTLEPRPRGTIFQAVVIARLVDRLTGAPVTTPTRIGTDTEGLRGRGTADGFVGLVATPTTALPALATQPYDVLLRVDAQGFAPRTETVTVPVQPAFPSAFKAVDLGPLELLRSPTVVEVRAYSYGLDPLPDPVPGATIAVTGHWALVADLDQPPDTSTPQAIGTPLAATHPAGASVDLPVLAQPAEPDRRLLAPAAAGQTRLRVSRAGGFVVGDLAGIDVTLPDLVERIEVVAVTAAADTESPAELELRYPLAHDHTELAPVVRLVAPAPTGTNVLTRPAVTGDRTLHLSSGAPLAGQVLRVGGGPAPEYVVPTDYEVQADATGVGTLPPVSSLAAVRITATSGGLTGEARVSLGTPHRELDLTLE